MVKTAEDVAPTSDGGFVIADTLGQRVITVSPRGSVTVLAGTGRTGYEGDGGPARAAELDDPSTVAVAPDDSVAIGDAGTSAPESWPSTGRSTRSPGPARALPSVTAARRGQRRSRPPNGLAYSPDGAQHISEARVRRVSTDGRIQTIAAAGQPTASGSYGDGGPATQARLAQPAALSIPADGSLLISDTGTNTIRHVDRAHIIDTFAGRWYGQGDYKSACAAQANAQPWPSRRLDRPPCA
jgi:hypothetical protein